MKIRTTLLFICVLLLCCVAGAGGYYYFKIYLPAREHTLVMNSIQESHPARNALYAGDNATAISTLRSLIAKAPTKEERARLQHLLILGLFNIDNEADTSEAVSLSYTLINDYSVPAWIRALTLNHLALFMHGGGVNFYKKYFTQPPLDAFINTSGNDSTRAWTAYYKILALSDETYPTSYAEYSIAGNYYAGLLLSSRITTDQTPEAIATLMQKYVAEGDTRNDAYFYSADTIIIDGLYRARAMALSSRILKNKTPSDIEPYFKAVQTTIDQFKAKGQDMNLPAVEAAVLRWRFAYADFLLTNFGNTRNSSIVTLLAPFGSADATSPEIIGRLESIALIPTLSANDPTVVKAKNLAAISPEFKAFLVAEGVKF